MPKRRSARNAGVDRRLAGTCLLFRVSSVEQYLCQEKPNIRRSGQVKACRRHTFRLNTEAGHFLVQKFNLLCETCYGDFHDLGSFRVGDG